MTRVGLVLALPGEAGPLAPPPWRMRARRLLRERGVAARVSGIGPERAAAAARHLLAGGCEGLVSWGFGGGLDPALGPGDLVLPRAVIARDGRRLGASAAWHARVAARLGPAAADHAGPVAEAAEVVATAGAKAALRRATGAAITDMESAAVARAALDAGVPWLALRAVADPAGAGLPAWLPSVLDGRGRPRIGRVAAVLGARPAGAAELLRLAGYARSARRALAVAWRLAGDDIAVPQP